MSLLSIAVSSEKVILSESGEKYAQIKHYLLSKAVLNNYVVGIWCETLGMNLEEELLWIMEIILVQDIVCKMV